MDIKVNIGMLLLLLSFSMGLAGVLNQFDSSTISLSLGSNMSKVDKGEQKLNETSNQITLKVALFPYIPDSGGDNYAGLQAFIKKDFESSYPQYNLQLRQIDPYDDFYNVSILANWLTDSVNGYDIVEIDTVILGDLVNLAIVSPQSILSEIVADWQPAAVTAARFNQAFYAYPHLLCAFFLFTYNAEVSQARSITELVEYLGDKPSKIDRIVGNLKSSWDLPALWLNSYHDIYVLNDTSDSLASALHAYQGQKFEALRLLARLCDVLKKPNRCLSGAFKDPDVPTNLFTKGGASAMFGYSERLFKIIKDGPPGALNDVKVSPLPLGISRKEPVFFTDAFVFRRNMTNDVKGAAMRFVQYMSSPRMQSIFVGSGDVIGPKKIPRYLLPVSKLAYDQPLLKLDPIFQNVFRNLNGPPYPNIGFLNARKELESAIMQYIEQ